MTSINLLYFSAPGCYTQRFFKIRLIQAQQAKLGMHRQQWND
jgi:hypothetical protein